MKSRGTIKTYTIYKTTFTLQIASVFIACRTSESRNVCNEGKTSKFKQLVSHPLTYLVNKIC